MNAASSSQCPGERGPHNQAAGHRGFQCSPQQRYVGSFCQEAMFTLQYSSGFFFCLCAAVQHPLFPSPPSTLVFLATLVLCLFRDLFLSMMFLMVALLLQLIHGSSSLTSHTSPLANLSIIENIHTTVKDTELFSYLYFLKHGRGYCLSLLFVT